MPCCKRTQTSTSLLSPPRPCSKNHSRNRKWTHAGAHFAATRQAGSSTAGQRCAKKYSNAQASSKKNRKRKIFQVLLVSGAMGRLSLALMVPVVGPDDEKVGKFLAPPVATFLLSNIVVKAFRFTATFTSPAAAFCRSFSITSGVRYLAIRLTIFSPK